MTAPARALALAGALLLPGTAGAQEPLPAPGTIPMQGNQFLPAELTVAPGTTVTWVNLDGEDHDVLAVDTSFWSPRGLHPGESYAFTFTVPGVYVYVCDLHHNMAGVITVAEAPPPDGEAPPVADEATGRW
jgi:plastocyanin